MTSHNCFPSRENVWGCVQINLVMLIELTFWNRVHFVGSPELKALWLTSVKTTKPHCPVYLVLSIGSPVSTTIATNSSESPKSPYWHFLLPLPAVSLQSYCSPSSLQCPTFTPDTEDQDVALEASNHLLASPLQIASDSFSSGPSKPKPPLPVFVSESSLHLKQAQNSFHQNISLNQAPPLQSPINSVSDALKDIVST